MSVRGLIVHSAKDVWCFFEYSYRNQVTHPCHARLHCILILFTAGSMDLWHGDAHHSSTSDLFSLLAGPATQDL